jgi:hypothetical protein
VKYFFDNCISYRLAAMLSALDVDAVSLRDEFAVQIQDPDFLAQLKSKHDVYLTYDHRQKTRQAEARAIREAGVTALWLGRFWGKKTFWQQAKWLINRWETIQAFATGCVPGTCADIQESGRAKVFTLR